MKRSFVFYASLALSLLASGTLRAQMTAEFQLTMTLNSQSFTHTAGFGYDVHATDSNDYPNFGESDYPGDLGGGFPDFYMVNNLFPSGATPVDIRHKPDSSSFSLQYEWNMIPKEYPSTITWDGSKIPALVKHIFIVPKADPSRILKDMKTASSITIPNQDTQLFYQNCYLILLYNEESASVRPASYAESLLGPLAAYPNPFSDRSTLKFELSQPAQATLSIYDETGRIVLSKNWRAASGSNVLPIYGLGAAHGPLFVRLQAEIGGNAQVRELMLMGQ